jgi:hypothetical protein
MDSWQKQRTVQVCRAPMVFLPWSEEARLSISIISRVTTDTSGQLARQQRKDGTVTRGASTHLIPTTVQY